MLVYFAVVIAQMHIRHVRAHRGYPFFDGNLRVNVGVPNNKAEFEPRRTHKLQHAPKKLRFGLPNVLQQHRAPKVVKRLPPEFHVAVQPVFTVILITHQRVKAAMKNRLPRAQSVSDFEAFQNALLAGLGDFLVSAVDGYVLEDAVKGDLALKARELLLVVVEGLLPIHVVDVGVGKRGDFQVIALGFGVGDQFGDGGVVEGLNVNFGHDDRCGMAQVDYNVSGQNPLLRLT